MPLSLKIDGRRHALDITPSITSAVIDEQGMGHMYRQTAGDLRVLVQLLNPVSRLSAGFPATCATGVKRAVPARPGLASGVLNGIVSFLQFGRANPSRSMILQLSETLEVPLRDRNAWLDRCGLRSRLPHPDPRRPPDGPGLERRRAHDALSP